MRKKSKLEARERRQGRGGEAASPAHKGSHGAGTTPPTHQKKKASASHHRATAQRTDVEEEFEKLEALFGDGLAGLSGLELADPAAS